MAGFAPERRPFYRHVTLVRMRRPIEIPPDVLRFFAADPWPNPFPIREVELLESVLDPAGAIYRRLASFPLE